MSNKLMLFALLFTLVMSLGFVVACGDDDDDDDDDDSSGDDDDDYSSGAYDDCVDFYMSCGGSDQATAEEYCTFIDEADGSCLEAVYSELISCYLDNVDCDNFTGDYQALTDCNDEIADDIQACL